MNFFELTAFVLYFLLVIGIGVYFFVKSGKNDGEKEYFLGGRKMGGAVAALSAGASDMSAWVLMGLPGAIYVSGLGQVWISIGLFFGTALAWMFIAPRLRTFSIVANDSITIPQFLTNRFLSKSNLLQFVCAIVFILVYTVYAASSISACGDLFQTVFNLDSRMIPMILATVIIIAYTFLGGFSAVCWTDFFQGLLMLGALMITPFVALGAMKGVDFVATNPALGENYFNLFSSGKFNADSIVTILSGLGWGLGYFGMPHILIRYMSVKSRHEMNRSRVIGTSWTFLILLLASIVGIVGRQYLGDALIASGENSKVFMMMVRGVFPALLSGVFLSAILAASMSTADSQLLASASAFASDVYKPILRKNASNQEMMWSGRLVVVIIAIVAFLVAANPNSGGIMSLVSNAWGGFGSAFGPTIILALYWKRFTYAGAVSGIIAGFVTDVLWLYVFSGIFAKTASLAPLSGLYEIIPGFIVGMLVCVIVSLCGKKPSTEVTELFDESVKFTVNEE